jgi:DNA-binding LacI/PurR family transcriptional regulator
MAALPERGVTVAVYGDAPAAAQFDRVLSDYEAGCHALTRWLFEQGRRRILIMGPQRDFYWFRGVWRVSSGRIMK